MDDLTADSDYALLRRLRKLVQISANDTFPLQSSVYDYYLQITAEMIRRQSAGKFALVDKNLDNDVPF